MKKTNFTFSGTCAAWLLRSIVPVLFFMTLSIGVGAQSTPGEAVVIQSGYAIVNTTEARPRLQNHILDLQALTATTPEEEVNYGIRLDYAMFIAEGLGNNDAFAYHVVTSMNYLEKRVNDFASQYRPSTKTVFDEMVNLLQ